MNTILTLFVLYEIQEQTISAYVQSCVIDNVIRSPTNALRERVWKVCNGTGKYLHSHAMMEASRWCNSPPGVLQK
jgi:hypothetical protein